MRSSSAAFAVSAVNSVVSVLAAFGLIVLVEGSGLLEASMQPGSKEATSTANEMRRD